MARTLPDLGAAVVAEIEAAWQQPQQEWARRRLQVVRLIAQHELTVAQIMRVVGVSRQTVFTYRDLVMTDGVAGLLQREHPGGRQPAVRGPVAEEFLGHLTEGKFRRAKDAQAWIKKRTRRTLSESGVRKVLRRLGWMLKSTAQEPRQKGSGQGGGVQSRIAGTAGSPRGSGGPGRPSRSALGAWEHRYGLLPVIRWCWALKGVRVHAPYATRYQWGYLHEAMEVAGANAMELRFTTCIDQDVHVHFLQQISQSDPTAVHVVIQDQAGFHIGANDPRLPANVRLLPLPPYSPELNPVEKLGDPVKDQVCNRLYPSLRKLEDRIIGALRPWRTDGTRVAALIGDGWLLDGLYSGAPT